MLCVSRLSDEKGLDRLIDAMDMLDRLLRREGRAPVRVVPSEPMTDYRGADAELLRLQQEVLALALEALGTDPRRPRNDPAATPEP